MDQKPGIMFSWACRRTRKSKFNRYRNYSSIFLAYAYVFSINDFFDYKIGYERKVKVIHNKNITFFMIIFPLLILFITLPFTPFVSLIFLLLFLILFSLYSIPPFRLKKHFISSLTINALSIGAFSFLGSYFFAKQTIDLKTLIFPAVFTMLMLIYEIIHQISHMKNDKKDKIKSLPLSIGIEKSLKAAIIIQLLILVIAGMALLIGSWNILLFLGTFIFSILRIWRIKSSKNKYPEIRNKIFGLEEGIYYFAVLILL